MKKIEITQKLLSSLTFEPVTLIDTGDAASDSSANDKMVFKVGNVLKLKKEPASDRFGLPCDLDEYVLVGHINEMSGFCDDCRVRFEQVEAIAHISRLFDRNVTEAPDATEADAQPAANLIDDYKKCPECAAQRGAAMLCKTCLHNRALINILKREIDRLSRAYNQHLEARGPLDETKTKILGDAQQRLIAFFDEAFPRISAEKWRDRSDDERRWLINLLKRMALATRNAAAKKPLAHDEEMRDYGTIMAAVDALEEITG